MKASLLALPLYVVSSRAQPYIAPLVYVDRYEHSPYRKAAKQHPITINCMDAKTIKQTRLYDRLCNPVYRL
ncbi:hypothetical protein DSO57_1007773 [Entomophthora muscae]|uniref:Uncharacterized protein n=1 Tax=Entomophthora muscae TaxID=34485 RepID=A0ACC2UT70_9FUNG|nr:hypothetical protein DSO57_1007773 [Entomophthora muscae]